MMMFPFGGFGDFFGWCDARGCSCSSPPDSSSESKSTAFFERLVSRRLESLCIAISLAGRLHRGRHRLDSLGKVIKSEADPAMRIGSQLAAFRAGGQVVSRRSGVLDREQEVKFSMVSGSLAALFYCIG